MSYSKSKKKYDEIVKSFKKENTISSGTFKKCDDKKWLSTKVQIKFKKK